MADEGAQVLADERAELRRRRRERILVVLIVVAALICAVAIWSIATGNAAA